MKNSIIYCKILESKAIFNRKQHHFD